MDKNGNKHFYETNKIHTMSNSHVSASKSNSTDSINNSIPFKNNDINTTTKYSIQELKIIQVFLYKTIKEKINKRTTR